MVCLTNFQAFFFFVICPKFKMNTYESAEQEIFIQIFK